MPCDAPWRHTQKSRDSSLFVITSAGRVLVISSLAILLNLFFSFFFSGVIVATNAHIYLLVFSKDDV